MPGLTAVSVMAGPDISLPFEGLPGSEFISADVKRFTPVGLGWGYCLCGDTSETRQTECPTEAIRPAMGVA
jgi:hypothetical protein